MRRLVAVITALALVMFQANAAWADFVFTQGTGTTSVGFDSTHSGTSRCAGSNAVCFGFVPMDTAGNFLATAPGTGNTTFALPMQGVSGGVAMPISAASLPLPTGASTAAGLTTINTTLGSPFQAGGSIGNTSFGATLNSTPSLANGNGVVPTQGGAVLSATNGAFTNLLQGNAALSATNGAYVNILLGNAASATGAGATGATTQRVGVAQDTTTIAGSAPGTAGTASSNVISAQGIASMTPFLVNPGTAGNFGIYAQGSTTSGQNGVLNQAAVTTSGPTYTTGQTAPLSLDTSGNLRVNVVAGGGSGGTSSSFAATFPATGTAAGAEYLSSPPTYTTGQMNPLQTDVNGNLKTVGVFAQGSTTSGQVGLLNQAAVVSGTPSYTNAQTDPMTLDTAGNLRVNCTTGCSSSGGSSLADEGTFTQGTTSMTVTGALYTTSPTSLTSGQAGALRSTSDRKLMTDQPNSEVAFGGASAATDALQAAGVYNSSSPTLTTGQGAALQLTSAGSLHTTVDNGPPADEATFTAGTTQVSPVGGVYSTGSISLSSGESGAFRLTTDRAVWNNLQEVGGSNITLGQTTMSASLPVALASNQSTLLVQPQAGTAGGESSYGEIVGNNTTGISVKGSAGMVYDLQLGGIGSSPVWVKLYNTASSPTCGSGTPVARYPIPVNSTAANAAGSNITIPIGRAFSSGIGLCVTGGIADTDTTSPSASSYTVNIGYD